jgi:hypothetical protein
MASRRDSDAAWMLGGGLRTSGVSGMRPCLHLLRAGGYSIGAEPPFLADTRRAAAYPTL